LDDVEILRMRKEKARIRAAMAAAETHKVRMEVIGEVEEYDMGEGFGMGMNMGANMGVNMGMNMGRR
jgi:hypothetical protein